MRKDAELEEPDPDGVERAPAVHGLEPRAVVRVHEQPLRREAGQAAGVQRR
jgi:hypothetical protein